MANKEPVTTKRRVKNPETFRERASKATEEDSKPKRTARLRTASGKVVKPLTRPIRGGARKLRRFRPLRPVFKVLGFIGKIIVPVYVRNSWRELRQVTWPDLQQSRRLTIAVLIFAALFGATVAIVDYGLDKVFKSLLL